MRDELDDIRREAEALATQMKLIDEFREAVAEKVRRQKEKREQFRVDGLKVKKLMEQIEANQRLINDFFVGVEHKSLVDLLEKAMLEVDAAATHLLKLNDGRDNPYRGNQFINDEIIPIDEFE